MFKLIATRGPATYEQFLSGPEANEKSKYLASQGFTVTLTHVRS